MSVARVTIAYRNESGASFRREHHLPLAVGTSMRYAAITACRCDRPVPANSRPPYACQCLVAFAPPAARAARRSRPRRPNSARATDLRPQVLLSGIVPFDLRQAQAVARAG